MKEKKTCKHFRFQVPSEDANLLREEDEEFCEICDVVVRLNDSGAAFPIVSRRVIHRGTEIS
jgi:hypothetical protein